MSPLPGTPAELRGVWRIASTSPDRIALAASGTGDVTFAQLVARAHAVAHGYRRAGLRTGDAVAVMAPNAADFIVLYLAAIETGLYFVPVNHYLVDAEITYLLTNSGAGLFVAAERFGDQARVAADAAGIPPSRRIAIGRIAGFGDYASLTDGPPGPGFVVDAAWGEAMSYTSGTTGRPKGVRRPLGNGDVLATLELTGQLTLGPTAEQGGVHLVSGPLYFRGPFIPALVALHLGQTLVLMDRWTPERMLDLIEEHRVTSTYLVPTMIHRLLRVPVQERRRRDMSSLRYVLHSAAPCPVADKIELLHWLGPIVYETYGGTEGGGTFVGPREWLERPGTLGRAWPGAEIHVLDQDGHDCPPGRSGLVYIRPTSPDFGYHDDPAKTTAAKRGRLHTLGDIGYLDEDGYLFLHGRRDDLILSGGVNVYPAEIEAALLLHPLVEDVAVFGVPDEEWGERVHALVVPAVDADRVGLAAEMERHCRANLAAYKVPRAVEFRDALPRTSAGKLNKSVLAQPYWADARPVPAAGPA